MWCTLSRSFSSLFSPVSSSSSFFFVFADPAIELETRLLAPRPRACILSSAWNGS